MTTTFQVSDKLGDAIFVVKVDADDPGQAFGEFAHALSLVGNQEAERVLARLEAVFGREVGAAPAPLAPAVATVTRTFPQAQPVANAYQGGPPPLPAAAQGDGEGAPTCQHGQKQYKTGIGKTGKEWKAWACPARSSDPTRCEFEWIR